LTDIALQNAAAKAPELVALCLLVGGFVRYLKYLSDKDTAREMRHERLEHVRLAVFERVTGSLDRNSVAFEKNTRVLERVEQLQRAEQSPLDGGRAGAAKDGAA
jgi:hypothetical protein